MKEVVAIAIILMLLAIMLDVSAIRGAVVGG